MWVEGTLPLQAHFDAQRRSKMGLGRELHRTDFELIRQLLHPVRATNRERLNVFPRGQPGRLALFILKGSVRTLRPDGSVARECGKGDFVGHEAMVGGSEEAAGVYAYDCWTQGDVCGFLVVWENVLALAEVNLPLALKLICAVAQIVTWYARSSFRG